MARSAPPAVDRRSIRVLDVACGTGTLARRLAEQGYDVAAVDPIARLIDVAQRAPGARRVTYHVADLAREQAPGGPFDVLVSMHSLYWHDDPGALLDACRRALRPGGHGIFLTYARPAAVVSTFPDLRAPDGWRPAVEALRWLVPTAVFEMARDCERRYLDEDELLAALGRAGFEVLESRTTVLAGISLLAWVRTPPTSGDSSMAPAGRLTEGEEKTR